MTDSMKFGPEWLRFNMKSDSSLGGGGPAAQTAPSPIKMAEFRYGREEMLALFHRNFLPPDPLKQMSGLFVEKSQQPLALSQMSDDETRLWNRGFNSDKPRQGPGMNIPGVRGGLVGGRGGSVDRGRGRARGSYHYSRGLSYEEGSDTPNGFNNRPMRNYDRTQSQGNWGERNGGEPGDYNLATSPRKEFGNRGGTDTNWRKHRGGGGGGGEDEEGWRASRNEKWGRGNSWREGDSNWERPRPWEEGGNTNTHPNHPRKPWENEESNLPEWAMENPSESGGTFDASGAFHGGANNSDDEEGNQNNNNQRRTEGPRNSRTQPRPTPQTKKEPPNISNGVPPPNKSENADSKPLSSSSGSSGGPLRQSQSATNLPSEQDRRPTTRPLTTSASFSGGVNQNTSQPASDVKSHQPVQPRPLPQPQREESIARSQAQSPPHRTAPPSFPTQHPVQTPITKPSEVSVPVATVAPITMDPRASERPSHEEEIEQRLLDQAGVLVSRLMEEEDREPPRHIPSCRTSPPGPPHAVIEWFYQDPQGNVQGPFPASDMSDWNTAGYFKPSLLVRRALDEKMTPLNEFMRLDPDSPFNINYYRVPPIKNAEPVLPPMPLLDDTLHLQMQLQQQRQAAAAALLQRQALAKLAQSEQYNSLSLDQKQMAQAQIINEMMLASQHSHPSGPAANSVAAMLQQLYLQQQQQQQQQPQQTQPPQLASNKMAGTSGLEPVAQQLDPVQQLFQQMSMAQTQSRPPLTPQNTPAAEDPRTFEQFMNAFRLRQANPQPPPPPPPQQLQPPPQMESVWGGAATTVPTFPSWANPLVGSTPPTAPSHWAEPVAKGIKTEHEILEEQRRAEDKKKLEELRKQQELQRIKEEEEAERQRRAEEEEEIKRKIREEEKEKERELKRMQEEEERKKKEAAAAKKAEQDRLRKEEEKKRKEEEKRRKEEEKRKVEEEKRRQEEAKKKAEEEKKKREEMTKKQNEALKRLQEQQQQAQARAVKAAVAPTPAPWITADTSSASLADIQKTERKQQQQLREQQEMMKAYQAAHQQEQQSKVSKNTTGLEQHLKWADNKVQQPSRVKSLAEIQAEEQELMAKQAEKEKAERMAAVKEVPVAATGSIWANQSLTWNTQQQQPPSVWGGPPATGGAVSSSGRSWDEVIVVKSNLTTKPAKGNATAAPQQQATAKSQAKSKAKKEEASVMKMFQNKLPDNSNSDTIKRWCAKVIPELPEQSQVAVDISTFVDFLLGFNTDHEIMGYISYCLGKNSATDSFAKEFINRRARLLSNDQTMTNHRSEPPSNPAQSNHFQEVKGKNKKVKKGKMTKVDNRILGFNVTAAPDRINVGDRDFVEGL